MKIYAASDHAGFELKRALVEEARGLGHEVEDLGPESADRVDYPDYAERVARRVAGEEGARGLLACGTGIGIAMAANKVPGVRAAVVWDEDSARLSREHNDSNVVALGARSIPEERARQLVRVWLATEFEGGRHAGRVEKIHRIERGTPSPEDDP